MIKIIPLVTFDVSRENYACDEAWRFQRGQEYEILGITDNMFNSNLTYLYLGDLDHCYLVEKKDIKIL
jgi:hypothetical protein